MRIYVKFFARTVLPGAIFLGVAQAFGAVGFSVTPSVVSNTYPGYITLLVTNLTVGDTVLVQDYLDANTNGVIDAGDIFGQQFQLTDGQPGMVIGGVTNINVPGDTDSVAGHITAQLNFLTGDISKILIGRHAFRLSSPAGHFTAITNSFTVANAAYSQSFTGNVVNNGSNVPNAIVILFTLSGGGLSPQVGAVANNVGAYSIKAAPDTYLLLAFKSNFVADVFRSPYVVLNGGATIITNVPLTNATQTISGKVVDAANSGVGLPGLLVPASSVTNSWFTVAFTDTNGNFVMGVRPDLWKIERNESGAGAYGYLVAQNNKKVDTSTGSVANVTISYPKATALFYGTIKDNLNQPLQGVDLFSSDNIGQYESDTRTDQNGYYTIGALCGTNWDVQLPSDTNFAFTNYNFSQSVINQNGGTNLACGPAASAQVNFTALPATNHISGWVRDGNGNALANIQITAYSGLIGGSVYEAQAATDAGGDYSLNVANGNWGVNLCCGCDNCGNNCLSTAYQCPGPQDLLNIGGNSNGVANFTAVLVAQPVLGQPSRLANGQVGFYLSGAVGRNYTIRASTNLTFQSSSWPTLLVTNLAVSPAFILDSHATNKQLFYRAFLGP